MEDMTLLESKSIKMGEYRFSIYAKWQIGLSIYFDGQIVLGLPFMDVRFSISKYAVGIKIFRWQSS
jgi:hypothetical protein